VEWCVGISFTFANLQDEHHQDVFSGKVSGANVAVNTIFSMPHPSQQ